MAFGRLGTRSGSELGNRLKDVRTARGLTQQSLADLVGVSRKTINTVERGVFVPSTTLALKLAEVLETPVERLFWLAEGDPD
ncbi:MAG: helix-turn-helix transcriptional regulator [Pseudomonadota bacterium]